MPESDTRNRVIVIGAGMGGLLAAHVLAAHFREVVVLERDRLPNEAVYRKGVPQSRHTHLLLGLGLTSLERLLPGITDDMIAGGAEPLLMPRDAHWLSPAGWWERFNDGLSFVSASRDLVEWTVRQRVLANSRITIRTGTEVVGLVPTTDRRGVRGVRTCLRPEGTINSLSADLVVDSSGRGSHAPQWLIALGWPEVREISAPTGVGYTSRFYRNPRNPAQDWKFMLLQTQPPQHTRSGMLLPVDGDRWMVSLVGVGGDHPPNDEHGFLEFARSLRSPILADVLRDAEPLTPIHAFRVPDSRRRRFDKIRRWPTGFAVICDAVCSLNPMYGQGMSIAAATAIVLDDELRRTEGTSLGRRFQRRVARTSSDAWLVASGEDTRYLTAGQGSKRPMYLTLMQAFFDKVLLAASADPVVSVALLDVLNLQRSPFSVLRPHIIVRALLVARRVAAGRAKAEPAPTVAQVPPRPRSSPEHTEAAGTVDSSGRAR